MTNNKFQKSDNETNLYNNILLLSRNKIFYTKFKLADTFQNRIILIFLHISFLFVRSKHDLNTTIYKNFYQRAFDLLFKKIELNMREVGYSDTLVNKNMKFLIKSFYEILLYCEKFNKKTDKSKDDFFSKFIRSNNNEKKANNKDLVDYFNKFETFCFDLHSDSVLKGEIKFNYN